MKFLRQWHSPLTVLNFVLMGCASGFVLASTLQSVIGIHHPNIRQIAQGAMGGSFNIRAFIHTYGAAVVQLARRFFLIAGFIIPVLLLAISNESPVEFCSLAFLIQYAGLLAERWYFFIEAEHPQNVYYQMIS